MRPIAFLVFSLILACCARDRSGTAKIKDEFRIVDSVFSNALNERREVWIYLPTEPEAAIKAGKKFPVVYLLDGASHFYSVAGMIQQLSQSNGNTVCPEM